MAQISDARLRRLRLAAQRLSPETAAADPAEAARAVLGIQAQDVRAARLALRSRVPGLVPADVDAADLLRTWTVRGTVHLIAAGDQGWLSTLTGPRNRRRFDGLMAKRGNLELARSMLGDIVALLEAEPRSRAELLERLAELGHASLGPRSVNVVMAWATAVGPVIGLPDGRFRTYDPQPAVDEEEALATLARRYLEGYGPASARDLAHWSGLPLGMARRALAAAGELEVLGDLHALPGALEADPPPPPAALLLAAFDTSMLGWASRELLVEARHERRVLPGGGMLRPVVLARGRASGTWRLRGSGGRRRVEIDPFGPAPAAAALRVEVLDLGRFLSLDLELAA